MVNRNERSKIRFYWYFGLFPETILKIQKPVYLCFIYNVSWKTISMVNIKKFKYCENLLTYSNANNNIRQYVNDDIEQVFPMGAAIKQKKLTHFRLMFPFYTL